MLHNSNPKLYWQIIDKLKDSESKDSLASDIDSEDWIRHFKNLSLQPYSDDSLNDEISLLESTASDNSLNVEFTIREIKVNIRKLKNSKACGEDLILNEMIKSGADILLPSITKLFNLILKNGHFPEIWNTNLQTPIYKSGNNLGKLFTSVMQSRLLHYLEENNKISAKQAAFRPGFATTDHLFTLKSLINKYSKTSKVDHLRNLTTSLT